MADDIVPFKAELERAQAASELEMRMRKQAEILAASRLKTTRALEVASVNQTQTIARLSEEIASLNMLLAERAQEARLIHELANVEEKRHARAERKWSNPEKQIAELKARAEEQLTATQAELKIAREEARVAREEAAVETALVQEAEQRAADQAHDIGLLKKRLARAEARAIKVRDEEWRPADRTAEEWAALRGEAERKAGQRERQALRSFLASHEWRPQDVASVLNETGMLSLLFDTKEGMDLFMGRARNMLAAMEHTHFGNEFALFLHFELHLTLDKMHRIMQAACKQYEATTNSYRAKVLYYNKHRAKDVIKVPRLVPPRHKIEPVLKRIYDALGTETAEDGRLAFTSFDVVIQEMLARDVGHLGMPSLSAFIGGELKLPIVVHWDATGFGRNQFNTIAARNPYLSRSAQLLRPFGLGNCDDGRDGTVRLLGPNLQRLNTAIKADQDGVCIKIGDSEISPEVLIVTDVSALRHCERLANSGWCSCTRDFALRDTTVFSKKPENITDLKVLLGECKSPTCEQRYVLSHNTLPGESRPRPCPCCSFGHDPAKALKEQAEMYAEEAEFAKEKTKAGKARYSKWRMNHAHEHRNVQPGRFGEPMLRHDLDSQLLDPLHMAELGVPKTPWKHGVLNNASDDAREQISEQLREWKHPLDCRRKEDNRSRAEKWFTGEAWASFCAGTGGSPGGPMAIAQLMLIVADDLKQRGVSSGMGDLDMIRELFGSRANTIINCLLAFDAYFAWYYPLKKSIPFRCDMAQREERALDNARRAIDMHEIMERVTIRNHKSFLVHGAIYKLSRDILKVGDVWATDLSPLELQNAETKRVAKSGGANRLTMAGPSQRLVAPAEGTQGPHQLIKNRAYTTTMALSTLRKMLGQGYLRRGDGVESMPAARSTQRLFGEGRSKRKRGGACKMELLGVDYDPRQDTCIKAFVRLLAARAQQEASPEL